MKINLTNKLLIGAMALTSCQKPIMHQAVAPITKTADVFVPSFKPDINPEKTFNLIKNIAEFFSEGINGLKGINTGVNVGVKHKPVRRTAKRSNTKPVQHKRTLNSRNVNVAKPSSVMPVERQMSPTISNANHWISGHNISYAHPTNYTIPKGASQKASSIASANGVSLYRLQLANPDIDFTKPISAGTVVKIPERYIVTPGSVKNFDDVVNTTKVSRHYINDILICIEGRHQKPDLVCKSDRVRSREFPSGCPTIGFGHTGRVDGQIIVNGRTRITEEKAYELLAQDILDAKIDAIVYMGKSLFNSAPESVQTGIVDIVFNKGVEPFTRKGSPTMLIKGDLERGDYGAAAAHTVLKTGNRGLKKRNVFRTILSTANLSQQERNRTLDIARPHYIETLNRFAGKGGARDRNRMQKAWANAKNGITSGFFNN